MNRKWLLLIVLNSLSAFGLPEAGPGSIGDPTLDSKRTLNPTFQIAIDLQPWRTLWSELLLAPQVSERSLKSSFDSLLEPMDDRSQPLFRLLENPRVSGVTLTIWDSKSSVGRERSPWVVAIQAESGDIASDLLSRYLADLEVSPHEIQVLGETPEEGAILFPDDRPICLAVVGHEFRLSSSRDLLFGPVSRSDRAGERTMSASTPTMPLDLKCSLSSRSRIHDSPFESLRSLIRDLGFESLHLFVLELSNPMEMTLRLFGTPEFLPEASFQRPDMSLVASIPGGADLIVSSGGEKRLPSPLSRPLSSPRKFSDIWGRPFAMGFDIAGGAPEESPGRLQVSGLVRKPPPERPPVDLSDDLIPEGAKSIQTLPRAESVWRIGDLEVEVEERDDFILFSNVTDRTAGFTDEVGVPLEELFPKEPSQRVPVMVLSFSPNFLTRPWDMDFMGQLGDREDMGLLAFWPAIRARVAPIGVSVFRSSEGVELEIFSPSFLSLPVLIADSILMGSLVRSGAGEKLEEWIGRPAPIENNPPSPAKGRQ